MTRLILISIVSIFLFTSCAHEKSRHKSAAYAYSNSYSGIKDKEISHDFHSMEKLAGSNAIQEKARPAAEDRKVIYNASMQLQSKQVDTTNANLMRIAHKYGGYIMSSGPERASIRVRSERLNDALNDIAKLGKVKERKVWGNDVTEEYVDLEIRLDNMKKTRVRYLELLQKANNVEETLKVEKELERLSREIDLVEGKLNRLSHLTEYSTVDVYYKSKPKPGVLGYVFIGLYKGVKWLFIRG